MGFCLVCRVCYCACVCVCACCVFDVLSFELLLYVVVVCRIAFRSVELRSVVFVYRLCLIVDCVLLWFTLCAVMCCSDML